MCGAIYMVSAYHCTLHSIAAVALAAIYMVFACTTQCMLDKRTLLF